MKIALEVGETLEVLLLNKQQVIGSLNLQICGLQQVELAVQPASKPTFMSAASSSSVQRAKSKRTMSPEARERLRQAQILRWQKIRAQQAEQQSGSEQSGMQP